MIWFDPFNLTYEPKGCVKLAFSTPGLLDGFSGKIVNVGDHDGNTVDEYCTANDNGQILCFEFDGLTVDPASEVLIDEIDLPGLITSFNKLGLASSNGTLFVADSETLFAVNFDSGRQVDTFFPSTIDSGCNDGNMSIEVGPDLDANGVQDLLLGNFLKDSDKGIFCELFMSGTGTVLSTKVMTSGTNGVPVLEFPPPVNLVQSGADVVYYGDNGDGTFKVLVSMPTSDSVVGNPIDGGFMEYDLASGLPEACDSQPATGCLEAPQGQLKIGKKDVPGKDKMQWKWQKGPEFVQADLGNPVVDTVYTVCVYDEDNGTTRVAGAYEIPAGPAWTSKDPKGLQLKDKVGSPEGDYLGGVTKAKIKTGVDGKTQVQVGWKGTNFTAPDDVGGPAGFFTADPAVTVQLHNSSTSTCWSSTFEAASFKSNELQKVQAQFKP